jgi:hypothetical protein
MATIIPFPPRLTDRTMEQTIAQLPPERYDVWRYYDLMPWPLLTWARDHGMTLPYHDSFGNPIAYYPVVLPALTLTAEDLAWAFDRARQTFAGSLDGSVICPQCANASLAATTDPDPTRGLYWNTWSADEVGMHSCDSCLDLLED